jgi:hypothetical protein
MSAPDKSSRRPTITHVNGAGVRDTSKLLNNVRTRLLKLRYTLGVNITVAGAGLRNRGSLLGAFLEAGLAEAGTDRINLDPRLMSRLSNFFSLQPNPATRLANANIQNVTLSEEIILPLAHPYSANPQESFYVEADIKNTLEVFSTFNGNAALIVNGGTVALSNPQVSVSQAHDVNVAERPAVDVFIRQVTQQVSGANTALEVDLRGSRYLAGIIVQQDTNVGEVTDIINSLVFRGDGYDIIGPTFVPWTELVQEQAYQSGGADVDGASWMYNFVKSGRMSTMLHPAMLSNLRLECNVQPSVAAGATSSLIRVALIEYERRPGVTSAEMPFTV